MAGIDSHGQDLPNSREGRARSSTKWSGLSIATRMHETVWFSRKRAWCRADSIVAIQRDPSVNELT